MYSYDSTQMPMMDVPIVMGGTAYDDASTNMTYILVFNEALYYGPKLSHSLINPNQYHHYGLEYNDNPYDKEKGLYIVVNDELTIPMTTKGTKVLFQSRVPSNKELETCPHIEMTSSEQWNPNEISMVKSISSDKNIPGITIKSPRIAYILSMPNYNSDHVIWEYEYPV